MNEVDLTQKIEQRLLMIVAHAGDANAKVFDAIDEYESSDTERAYAILDEAQKELLIAHRSQYELMNEEAQGEEIVPSILMIHAMDICMNAANSIQYTKRLIALLETKK